MKRNNLGLIVVMVLGFLVTHSLTVGIILQNMKSEGLKTLGLRVLSLALNVWLWTYIYQRRKKEKPKSKDQKNIKNDWI